MSHSLAIEPVHCTGCKQCEVACSFTKEGAINPSLSRIHVFAFKEEGRHVPFTCTQCTDAWCMHACPTDAIRVDATTGAKVVFDTTCVGCKVCTIACPFGTINYHVGSGKVAKCDLCAGQPACVEACQTGALQYIDSGSTGYARMRASARHGLTAAANA